MRLKSNHIGNILAGILILIIGLQCTACAETYWSIKQVAESTPERWTESYDTPWRTISIDVEIEVPTVEKIPIVRVHRMPAVQDEKLSDYAGTVRNVEGSLRADKKRDDFVSGDSRPQNTYSYTKGQTPDRKPENVEMTYAEALKLGYKEMEKIWGLKEDIPHIAEQAVHMDHVFQRKPEQGQLLLHIVESAVDLLLHRAADVADTVGQEAVVPGLDNAGMRPFLVDFFTDNLSHDCISFPETNTVFHLPLFYYGRGEKKRRTKRFFPDTADD